MKNLIIKSLIGIILLGTVGCSDWTTPSVDDIETDALKKLYSERDSLKWAAEDLRDKENKEAYEKYLENLREYKKTVHPIMFGWFNGWDPDRDAAIGKLSLMPDSMDVVSIWGGPFNLSESKKEELRLVQSKGTKVVIGWIIEDIGDQIVWGRENWPEDDTEAIVAYATAIVDSIKKYNYDGFDYDYEPSYSSPFKPGNHCGNLTSCKQNSGKEKEILFMKTMRELLGPDKLFHLNGSIHWLDPSAASYFDRFVVQSYNGTAATFDRWENDILKRLGPAGVRANQIIYTETFENKPANRATLAEKYAGYAVNKNGNIGGIGVYHINEDAFETPLYKNVREAIQVMNPSIK